MFLSGLTTTAYAWNVEVVSAKNEKIDRKINTRATNPYIFARVELLGTFRKFQIFGCVLCHQVFLARFLSLKHTNDPFRSWSSCKMAYPFTLSIRTHLLRLSSRPCCFLFFFQTFHYFVRHFDKRALPSLFVGQKRQKMCPRFSRSLDFIKKGLNCPKTAKYQAAFYLNYLKNIIFICLFCFHILDNRFFFCKETI